MKTALFLLVLFGVNAFVPARAANESAKSIEQSIQDVSKSLEESRKDAGKSTDKSGDIKTIQGRDGKVIEAPIDPCRINPHLPQCL